jgi:hypothetical protein
LLRAYVRTAGGECCDLLVAGLVLNQVSSSKKLRERIISRLLGSNC